LLSVSSFAIAMQIIMYYVTAVM